MRERMNRMRRRLVAVSLFAALQALAESVTYEGCLDLAGEWRLEQVGKSEVNCPIAVPGDVHSALLAAGLIPDPYYGANEYQTLWVGRADWDIRRTFDVSAAFLAASNVILRLDEVDTFATVSLNGHKLSRTNNRFRRWDFDVKAWLRPGANEIAVRFDSALREGRALASLTKDSYHMQNTFFTDAMFVRKPACHGGWDWGPCLVTAGLLGKVELVATSRARIDYVYCDQRFNADRTRCEVTVNAEVFAPGDGETTLRAALGDVVSKKPVRLTAGPNRLSTTLVVESPRLWWPVNEGEAFLYPLSVSVGESRVERKIGLRTIELVTEPDAEPFARLGRQGTNMCFRVNGRKVFARGSNWIPADAFESRQAEKWRGLVASAAKANMNMLRIWGGGRFEGDGFYEACDELGVMLWHDFMFSCALYPDDAAFYANVRAEEAHQIRRLRDHPSIALWCGDNECISMLVGDFGWPDERETHVTNFIRRASLSREMVARYDPSRPYWSSSPSANGRDDTVIDCRRDGTSGDIHNWSVYFGWKPYWNYYDFQPRFCSEFGCQSMPSAEVGEQVAPAESVETLAADFMYHQKTPQGNRRIVDFLRRQFFAPASGKDFIYLSQVHQALAMKTACEYYRSLEPWCMGALVWQLNDNWPVASWSSLDYGGKWKPLHYQLKRTFAPLLVTAAPTEDSYARREKIEYDYRRPQRGYEIRDMSKPFDLAFYAVNDTADALEGEFTIEQIAFDGTRRDVRDRRKVALPAGRSTTAAVLSEDFFGAFDARRKTFLRVTLKTPRGTVEDFRFFDEFRHAPMAAANVSVETRDLGGRFAVTMRSAKPAFFVWANVWKVRGEFDDNFVHLLPGEPKTLVFTPEDPTLTLAAFRRALSVTDLSGTKKANKKPAATTVPADRLASHDKNGRYWWKEAHELILADKAALGPKVDFVLVGDSITYNWRRTEGTSYFGKITKPLGKEVADRRFGGYRWLNCGIGGDGTRQVIWRIRHGALDGFTTPLIALMIGTNDRADSAADVAEGIAEIVRLIREKHPEAKVLLSPIIPRFPREDDPGDMNAKNDRTNAIIRNLCDGTDVVWLDWGSLLVKPDGSPDERYYYDREHPAGPGYERWADALQPYLGKHP